VSAVSVRPGGPADDAACGQIIGRAGTASVFFDRLPHARSLFIDRSPLAQEGRSRLMAELDGEPVGFAEFRPGDGHVKYLFVLPDRQGLGIGAALLDAVQAAVGGPVSVHVLAVNDAGILWYLRRGFVVGGGFAEPLEGRPAAWIRMVRAAAPVPA
jgi:ribosomal protein S18 acetylase RimI-like enzyme